MKVVAIIGASRDRGKFGNKALRAFRARGYTVIPINPNEPEVEGLKAYASVCDVKEPIDVATFFVQPETGETILGDIAEKGIREVWINPGAESASLVARAQVLGIQPILACSIIGVGEDPDRY